MALKGLQLFHCLALGRYRHSGATEPRKLSAFTKNQNLRTLFDYARGNIGQAVQVLKNIQPKHTQIANIVADQWPGFREIHLKLMPLILRPTPHSPHAKGYL